MPKTANLSKRSAFYETDSSNAKIPELITGSSLTTGGIDLSSLFLSFFIHSKIMF